MTLEDIGILMRRRRALLNLTQDDLAALSGVANKTLNLIEQGKGNPSFETLNKIAGVLGLEIDLKIKRID